MGSGGARVNAGRKKKPDQLKLHTKTFCIDKDLLDWLNNSYGRDSHALIRTLLRRQHDKELRRSR